MRILVFLNFYLPAYKAGGPLRTIQGMVDYLSDEMTYYVITSDRDSGDQEPFPDVVTDEWTELGDSQVCYVRDLSRDRLNGVLGEEPWDVLYLQSFFDWKFTIRPLLWWKLGRLRARKVLLATRGEFSRGAISIKPLKKRVFIWCARMLGLYSNIYWQASSEHERADLLREIPSIAPEQRILIAPDLPPKTPPMEVPKEDCTRGDSRPLRTVFLSRISEMKNLSYAIEVLSKASIPIKFSIYGPVNADSNYWKQCEQMLEKLPGNVQWAYEGTVSPEEVPGVFAKHDVFLFPTRGENFGHVIFESLLAGCPVLLSDQTSWKDFEENGIGWIIPLSDQQRFVDIVESLANQDSQAKQVQRTACKRFADEFVQKSGIVDDNLKMFESIAKAD